MDQLANFSIRTGVDFIKVGPTAQNIVSIFTLCLSLTFEKLFTGAKVGYKAQKIGAGRNTVYEIDPSSSQQFYHGRPYV